MKHIFCQPLLRTVMAMALAVLGVRLSGCADMSDTMGLAFADPAKYDLYNCNNWRPSARSSPRRLRSCRA